MGVNEKVHPSTIVQAFNILHQRGIRKVGGILVTAGLGEGCTELSPSDLKAVREHTLIDEVSPHSTVVAFGFAEKDLGCHLLTPESFGLSFEPRSLLVENTTQAVTEANWQALTGTNPSLSDYLAMNASLGVVASMRLASMETSGFHPDNLELRSATQTCREAIHVGKAAAFLSEYIHASGRNTTR